MLIYSQPIVSGNNKGRPYVYFSHIITKKKYRFYSGVVFGMRSCRGLADRERELYFTKLAQTITIKLSEGWDPDETKENKRSKTTVKRNQTLRVYGLPLIEFVDGADYGKKHKYTLKWYWKVLAKEFGLVHIDEIQTTDIQAHLLKRYASSNTSYNTAKRYYRCLFNLLVDLGYATHNPVTGIKNRKSEPIINQAFSKVELKLLMDYLKVHDRTLYRVALLMYTTFLRPHQEIRGLKAKYFDFSSSLLILPPRFTKNGKQVTIPLQTLVIAEFDFVKHLNSEDLIFGEVNPDYFKTKWGKIKKKYTLKSNQTLYSIRHSAAVDMYHRTKDVALIQRMMHHSSMEVTIGYLRSLNCNLGVVNAEMYPSL